MSTSYGDCIFAISSSHYSEWLVTQSAVYRHVAVHLQEQTENLSLMLMCSGAFAARVNFSYASDYCDFFWPSLSVISRDSKNYAMQRSWNGRQSSCWTKLSCSKITLNRWIKIESRWYKQLASLLLLFIIIIILFKSGNNKVPLT